MVADAASLAGLIGAYLRAHVRRILEYRANFFIGLFAIMSRHVVNLVALAVIFFHTPGLGGWSPYEVVYLYGYVALIVAVWHLLFANTLRVEFLVRDAGFDRYLVRPKHRVLNACRPSSVHASSASCSRSTIAAKGCAARSAHCSP
jgi:ABC-type uncharacterized transport system permease subunit